MMTLFRIIILTLIIGVIVYIPFRLSRLFKLKQARSLYFIFITGTVSFFLTLALAPSISNTLFGYYYVVSTIFLGFTFYLLLSLFGYELVRLVFKPSPRISGIIAISLTIFISAYSIWHARSFEIVQVDIPIKNIKNEVKIVHLSDIHLGYHRGADYLRKIVTETNSLKPDLVLITGDLIDSDGRRIKDLLSPLKSLKMPSYFSPGNHDYYVGFDNVRRTLEENNVTLLLNKVVETNGLQLVGLDYMNADSTSVDLHSVNDRTIKDVLPGLDISADLPSILMQHSPVGMEYINQRRVALVLSGHTHAGQVFPATYLAGLIFPYNKGLHQFAGTYIYVSQGAGTFVLPMRLGTNNEITLINLIRE